ncbi:MAG TPA: hypothetical protein VFE37_28820 [Chloroflexota bacterium]|nr:hypothetical protein [Chloroflexota bacterium]
MAEVTAETRQDIERQLCHALWQWGRLPEVAATIDDWDQLDQIVFVEEWPLEEERLRTLKTWVAEGRLAPEQRRRYEKLMNLVAKHRPIIERLRAR